ncbi:hypothetical protein WJX73_001515 [Symbiochloris irregularis]|uniref:WD repeat-containing protein 55 n=1 Tax=Symbiochloris irregularis TaxID=706552 RepID=A0AAW1P5Q7_9CHLO
MPAASDPAQSDAITLPLPSQPMDCACHPTRASAFAVALISGRILAYNTHPSASTAWRPSLSIKAHKDSCRSTCFTSDGRLLLTASVDRSALAIDFETGKPAARLRGAHAAALSRVIGLPEATGFCTAADSGELKLWDTRQQLAVACHQAHTDFVTDVAVEAGKQCMLSVGADGCLSVLDLRANKVLAKSDGDPDDELLSVATVKNGALVACGAQSGGIDLFQWGQFEARMERITGCPASVDALASYDSDTLIAGCEDGLLRLLNVQPNKAFGVVPRDSTAKDPSAVERIALSCDKRHLVCVAHENAVQLCDLSFLRDQGPGSDDEEAQQEAEQTDPERRIRKKARKKSSGSMKDNAKASNMFADLL